MGLDAGQLAGVYDERIRRIIAHLDRRLRERRGERRRSTRHGDRRAARRRRAFRADLRWTTGSAPAAFPAHAHYVALGPRAPDPADRRRRRRSGTRARRCKSTSVTREPECNVLVVEADAVDTGAGPQGAGERRPQATNAARDGRPATRARRRRPATTSCASSSRNRAAPASPTRCESYWATASWRYGCGAPARAGRPATARALGSSAAPPTTYSPPTSRSRASTTDAWTRCSPSCSTRRRADAAGPSRRRGLHRIPRPRSTSTSPAPTSSRWSARPGPGSRACSTRSASRSTARCRATTTTASSRPRSPRERTKRG